MATMSKRCFYYIAFFITPFILSAAQISVPRIEKMSDMPSPYLMRDWKKVARDYDNLVFDTGKAGTHLPITSISSSNGINYPEIRAIKMDTYVGQSAHGNVAEAINIIPAIVGATLVGIDKTNNLNVNWVAKIKDFFNLKNGQNVYLNNYSTSTGNDWWYDVMPNVFFYQLYSLYPDADSDFKSQFTKIADRELDVLYKLGGKVQPWNAPYMNYRAFNLSTGMPLSTGVPEPEAAGSIAWIQYQAYVRTGNQKYLQGAELALDFLQSMTTNPSYEIQLPYGIATAARMNAVEGTGYDIDKFLNWTFCAGLGTLRGWGTIAGNWNGYDVSGLIGEANDKGNDYAFSMNGFQHAAALAPVAKYDKRYARAIGKWILNLANASRLFYRSGLPQSNQESASYAWSAQYDTSSCIPYESIKQVWNNVSPFAMGDAVKGGWAATNLSMYSGSSIGYMASLIEKTNVEGILRIDLNKTDFGCGDVYPVYLYYNPFDVAKTVELSLPSGEYDVYDAIGESTIKTSASGNISFEMPSDNVMELVIYPSGKTVITKGRMKTVDGKPIDYHYAYDYSKGLRIKAFSVSDTIVQRSDSVTFYCLPENNLTQAPVYRLYLDNVMISSGKNGNIVWKAPASDGIYTFKCSVCENNDTVWSHPVSVRVVEKEIKAPLVTDISFSVNMPFDINSDVSASAKINTSDVKYKWSCTGGVLPDTGSVNPAWHLPGIPGIYSVSVTASNTMGNSTFKKDILVKDIIVSGEPIPLIYYPLNGDTKNHARDAFHAISVNAVPATGANNLNDAAFDFTSSAAYLYTPNETALNFQDKVAVSFWIKPDMLATHEQFIISHGSWEERYKASITPEKKVRWTVKTNTGVVDVDDTSMVKIGQFDHFTAMYTGYSLELYRNGKLVSFKPESGNIKTTSKSITIARKDESTSDYSFTGVVDEVRIYDAELPQAIIHALPASFSLSIGDTTSDKFIVWSGSAGEYSISLPSGEESFIIEVFDLSGRRILQKNDNANRFVLNASSGIYILRITTLSGKVYNCKIVR